MKQELNYLTIDPCFELGEDKDKDQWTHKMNMKTETMTMEKEVMEMKELLEILRTKMLKNRSK